MDQYYESEFEEIFRNHREFLQEEPENMRFRRVWLTWEDLRVRNAQKKGIIFTTPHIWTEQLAGIWGIVGPGEIVAVAGESNSGKSLLLKVLDGHLAVSRGEVLSGRVLVNGEPRGRFWRRVCAHVSQDLDDLQDLLTIKEHLNYRAELALPAKWRPRRRQLVVQKVLEALDLVEVEERRVIHLNLSEKRRLKIGLALVGLPRVLLLDEPLNELDATMSLELMRSLHDLVRQRQMSLVISVKSVREAALPCVDKFLLLAQGRMVFYGPLLDAVGYFNRYLQVEIPQSSDNTLSFMLDAINCKACRRQNGYLEKLTRTWQEYAFDKQLYRANYPQLAGSEGFDDFTWHRSWIFELGMQLRRTFTLLYRDYTYWIGQTTLALFICLLVAFGAFQVSGEIYGVKARLNVLFYTAVFFQFFPFIPFLFVCHREKLILARERKDSIARVSPSYLSIWIVIYGFRFLLVTLYTCILYFIVGLRLPFNYTLVFWLTLIAESWVAMGMGYLLVTLISSLAIVETMASFILLICIWFSGDFAFNPTCTWILRWIAYLSPVFYAFNALVNNEFDGNVYPAKRAHRLQVGSTLLKEDGFINYGVWPSIGTLLGFGLLYMILGYTALIFITRPRVQY